MTSMTGYLVGSVSGKADAVLQGWRKGASPYHGEAKNGAIRSLNELLKSSKRLSRLLAMLLWFRMVLWNLLLEGTMLFFRELFLILIFLPLVYHPL